MCFKNAMQCNLKLETCMCGQFHLIFIISLIGVCDVITSAIQLLMVKKKHQMFAPSLHCPHLQFL